MNFLKQYLGENNLKMKMDNIKEKFICKICKDLIHEAKITPCGCVFCEKCISQYLENVTKKCPSCEQVDISMNILMDDYRIRNKISNVSIICPNKNCEARVIIKDVENHLINCDKKKQRCVLSIVGCSNVELTKEEMKLHLEFENEVHLKLLCSKICEESNARRIFVEGINAKLEEHKIEMESETNTKYTQTEEEKNKIIQESASCQTEEGKNKINMKTDLRIIEGCECQVVFTNMNLRIRSCYYYSDLFCIDKYCFVMYMCYYLNGDIEVSICLHRGPFDDEIEWPLKKSIEFNLLKQNKIKSLKFNKDSIGRRRQYFNKPGTSRYFLHDSIISKDEEIVDENNLNISIKLIN